MVVASSKIQTVCYPVIGIAFVVLVIVLTPWILRFFFGLEAPSKAGEFADQYGIANALFSGLAFVGVIGAILLQKQELELQRKELEQTRDELKGQKEQLVVQNKTLRQATIRQHIFRAA